MPGPHVCLFHRNRLLCECLATVLQESPGYECSVSCSATFDASSTSPFGTDAVDVLLLDAMLEDNLSCRVANHVRQLHPDCKVVLLVAEHEIDRMIELAQIGSHGCLFEGAGLADVRTAIAAVLGGGQFCSTQLANALFNQVRRGDAWTPQWDDSLLTPREREILELIACEQLGNKQIARHLGLSLYTVKNHVHNVIEKLGVQDRHEAVQFARRRGFLVGERAPFRESDRVRSPR